MKPPITPLALAALALAACGTPTGEITTSGHTSTSTSTTRGTTGSTSAVGGTTHGATTGTTGSADPAPADAVDLPTVTFVNPPDVSGWPATTALATVDMQAAGTHLTFDKKDGAGRWPDFDSGSGIGLTEYTLWLIENIGGQ